MNRAQKCIALMIWLLVAAPIAAHPHHEIIEREVVISLPTADAAGTLWQVGEGHGSICVVIVGGTLSNDRDGAMAAKTAPPRDALRRLSAALAAGGYSSLRYDKIGSGQSKAKAGWKGTYADEAAVVSAATKFARSQKGITRVVVAGESAGAYVACLAAKDGAMADGYLFLGGLCGPSAEMYEYNFGRLLKWAEREEANMKWAMQNARRDLALGRQYERMLAAAKAGDATFELVDGDFRMTMGLERRREELARPPDEMFRQIKAPALALAGELDMNVPPEHAIRAARIMREAGNANASSAIIEGADHSFQKAAKSEDERYRQRFSLKSFENEYELEVYRRILAWLDKLPAKAPPR